MTVGVFGGTFDPFHNGHMGILKFVLDNKVADRVIVAPAGTPRLREGEPEASPFQRYKMVSLAVATVENVSVSEVDIGLDRAFRSGTAYLLRKLRDEHTGPEHLWVLILGVDAAAKMGDWINADIIAKLAQVVVIGRPGYEWPGDLPRDHPACDAFYFEGPMNDISANQVRRTASKGECLDGLVPREVAEYIERNGLYKKVSLS